MSYVTKKEAPAAKGKTKIVYLARWKDKRGGKWKEKSFDKQREAKEFLKELKPAAEVYGWALGSHKTYGEVCGEYLSSLRRPVDGSDPVSAHTFRTYAKYLQDYSLKVLATHTIGEVNEEWMQNVRDYCVKNLKTTQSAKEAFRLCKAVMNFAEEQGDIERAPGQKLKIAKSRSDRMRDKIRQADHLFTPDHVRLLLRAADALAQDKQPQRQRTWREKYRPLTYFLAYTGARISEARGFPRGGVLHNQGLIRIRQKATEGGEIDLPKSTDGIRDIPLPSPLVEPMQTALRSHGHDLLFPNAKGEPMELRNLYNRMWKPLLEKADELAEEEGLPPLPKWGFHALRHGYASRLIAGGADLKRVQSWMGHHDPAYTVKQYGHLFEDKAADAAIMEKIAV